MLLYVCRPFQINSLVCTKHLWNQSWWSQGFHILFLFFATKTLWSPHFALLQCSAISCYEKCNSAEWFAINHLLHKMLYSNRVLFMTSDASYYFFLSKLFTMYDLIQSNVLNWKKTLYNWNSSCHIKLSLRSPSYSLGTQKSENNTLTI